VKQRLDSFRNRKRAKCYKYNSA